MQRYPMRDWECSCVEESVPTVYLLLYTRRKFRQLVPCIEKKILSKKYFFHNIFLLDVPQHGDVTSIV
jgi:hypothetical protein